MKTSSFLLALMMGAAAQSQQQMTIRELQDESPAPSEAAAPDGPTTAPVGGGPVEETPAPNVEETQAPTVTPTLVPTAAPTVQETSAPAVEGTAAPTVVETPAPTIEVTPAPTVFDVSTQGNGTASPASSPTSGAVAYDSVMALWTIATLFL